MEKMTREENKEKIKKVASGFYKALRVIKVLLIIGIVLTIIWSIAFFILGATDAVTTLYEKYPKIFGDIEITIDKDELMFIKNKTITLEEVYQNNELDKLMYGEGVMALAEATSIVVFYFIAHYTQKVFRLLKDNESPFDESLLKPFKVLFIVLTIIILTRSVFFGILTGGILACMYFIYLYGCSMQEDEDHTL